MDWHVEQIYSASSPRKHRVLKGSCCFLGILLTLALVVVGLSDFSLWSPAPDDHGAPSRSPSGNDATSTTLNLQPSAPSVDRRTSSEGGGANSVDEGLDRVLDRVSKLMDQAIFPETPPSTEGNPPAKPAE